jgi:hypothetical protein
MKTLALCALVAVAIGCGKSVYSGKVVEKGHNSAWVQIIPVQVGNTSVMNTIYHPEYWTVKICNMLQDCDTHSVTEAEFKSMSIGDFIRIPKD